MKKLFLGALSALSLSLGAASAQEWDVYEMNHHINETNFIIENFCSGTFISDEYNLILTNHHCVDGSITQETRDVVTNSGEIVSKRFEVFKPMKVSQKIYDGHELISFSSWMTEIVGYDESVDLAILRIKDDNMAPRMEAPIFTGEEVLRGETVYAIGNPLMLDATVTKGIISSTNRSIKVGWDGDEVPFFQMDAGIAGGSSGGSLYNVNGELIGVPAAAASGTMVGLAIPYTIVQDFLSDNCYASVFDPEAESHEDCMSGKGDSK